MSDKKFNESQKTILEIFLFLIQEFRRIEAIAKQDEIDNGLYDYARGM